MAASSTDSVFARLLLAYDCFRRGKLAAEDLRKVRARSAVQPQKQKQKQKRKQKQKAQKEEGQRQQVRCVLRGWWSEDGCASEKS